MNIKELTTAVANHTDLPQATVRRVLDSLGLVVAHHFATGDAHIDRSVALPVLGKLKSVTRAARQGINPKTLAPIQIPERLGVKFVAGKALDDILNPS